MFSVLAQVPAQLEVTSGLTLCKLHPNHNNSCFFEPAETHSSLIVPSRDGHLHLISFYGSDLSDTLNSTTGKMCFTIGKVSSARRDSLRDVQSEVVEQKPSLRECYCASCHVCLASVLVYLGCHGR